MKKNETSLSTGPGTAGDWFLRSVNFLNDRNVTTLRADEIPTDLLQAWITDDPWQLYWDIGSGRATPDEILPYDVYKLAYKCHDNIYAGVFGKESYRTSCITVLENFMPYQELLRIAAKSRALQIELPPFQIMHFNIYNKILCEVKDYVRKAGIKYK